jgi:hypothetical protein
MDIWVLTKLEKEGMQHIWEHRFKQQQVHSGQKSQSAPLVISEAHRSRLVLKYVFLFYFIDYSADVPIHSREMVLGSDVSDEDSSSSNCSNDHDNEAGQVAEPDDEGDILVVMGTDNDRGEPDLEYYDEWYSMLI